MLGGLVGSIEKTLAEEHSTADAALWWLEPSKGLVGAADDPMSSLSAHNLRQPLGDRLDAIDTNRAWMVQPTIV